MKTLRLERMAAALLMAAILMTAAAGQAEAKKKARAVPPSVISTDARAANLSPQTRYPEERGLGSRLTIERESMWAAMVRHWLN